MAVPLGTSLAAILRSFRGQIADARIAYPEVLHVKVNDEDGGLWRFATQDATFDPQDPESLVGRTLDDTRLDPDTGGFHWRLSGGLRLIVLPAAGEPFEDLPTWELITPDHITLTFGPGPRWQFSPSDQGLVPHG
jgi:hypothetical protein